MPATSGFRSSPARGSSWARWGPSAPVRASSRARSNWPWTRAATCTSPTTGLRRSRKLTPSGRQVWRRGGLGVETDPRLRGHQHLSGFDPSGRLLTVNDDAGVVLLSNPAGEVIGGFRTQIPSAKHTADTLRGG